MTASETGRIEVQGRLTIETVPALFASGLHHLDKGDLLVDFSRVEAVDSAAISLLLGWGRAALRNHRNLTVVSLPADLSSLAHLYGVDEFLPAQG